MKVGVLLLAAGRGTRFGSDKRRARLPDGELLLDRSIAAIEQTGLPLRVALGPDDSALARALRARAIETIRCAAAPRGMGATLADAVRQLPAWDAVLVALGDMPWLRPESIAAVARAAGPSAICIPCHGGRRGHPVAFGARFLPELGALDGDRGARDLLLQHSAVVRELPVDDPGILRDVDRPADLQRPPLYHGPQRS
ncbi:nucleotidyltransferase family protein [Pseudohaliea sp.]|uniref:nucleotidyltransferase family protein n=1 Tax=Pseudohaliea sp. TaxID=2740289 RepID=UPI0032EC7394